MNRLPPKASSSSMMTVSQSCLTRDMVGVLPRVVSPGSDESVVTHAGDEPAPAREPSQRVGPGLRAPAGPEPLAVEAEQRVQVSALGGRGDRGHQVVEDQR